MPLDLRGLSPAPAGFGSCAGCAYRDSGTPAICVSCATATTEEMAGPRCASCDQPLGDGRCANAVCNLDDRYFSRIYAVCDRPEAMWRVIMDYKYEEQRAWADVLGRILVGYLDEHRDEMAGYDLITSGAIYVGPRAQRLWDYLRLILQAAQREGPDWPFAPGLIAKSGPTGRFLGIDPQARREIAEGDLRAALSVPEPDRVVGRRILVMDDVYSEGYSLREMARALLDAGAAEVAGLVFARRKGG
jgi:predicted amidophosphoribosyltransferase